jgi:hypothetical protein
METVIMPDAVVHVVEDAFHRLQHPQPASPSTDEDLANAARVLIWSREPGLRGRVHASASNGRLTLTGSVDDATQRSRLEIAVSRLKGVEAVTNEIEIADAAKAGDKSPVASTPHHQVTSGPMLYVTRYCSVEPSSLAAALHGAVDVLDQRFAQLGLPLPEEVLVIYRNRLPETVTVDIGYTLSEPAQIESNDDLKLAYTPKGEMLSAPAQVGTHRLFEVHDQLLRHAQLANLAPANFAWQQFPLKAARLGPGHVTAPLYLPVEAASPAPEA